VKEHERGGRHIPGRDEHYDDVDDALADYEAAHTLWREGVADTYDAAVVTHKETAKSRS
jgi:hypothetical protein